MNKILGYVCLVLGGLLIQAQIADSGAYVDSFGEILEGVYGQIGLTMMSTGLSLVLIPMRGMWSERTTESPAAPRIPRTLPRQPARRPSTAGHVRSATN